jgi:23S rRNA (uracil1939-C5)-methyltransferase
VRKRFAEAEVTATLAPSPRAVEAPCPHFAQCGGCTWQDLDYAAQLDCKRGFVADALARLAKIDCPTDAPLASPRLYGFRNKMEFSFAGRGDSLVLGLRRRASHEVLAVPGCLLMEAPCAEVVTALRGILARTGLPAWHAGRREGAWRFAVVRRSATAPGLLVQLIVGPTGQGGPDGAGAGLEEIGRRAGEELMAAFPQVTGFVLGLRASAAQVAYAERTLLTLGHDELRETLDGLTYSFSAGSFFQTNTRAAELLYRAALEASGLGPDFAPRTVWDLYAGCGGITLFLARTLAALRPDATVAGLESGRAAVREARANGQANGLANCAFTCADLRAGLAQLPPGPGLVVADPPRGGMHADVVRGLLQAAPERLVYVSCDPATLARDAAALAPGFAPVRALPVDLFPHTPHVECVLALRRRD